MVIGFYQLTSGLDHMLVRQIVDQDNHRGNVLISIGDGSWNKGGLGSAVRCKRDDGEWIVLSPRTAERDPVGLPGQQLHMEYLAKHVEDIASYVKKMKLPAPGVDSPAVEEDEKAPYQVLFNLNNTWYGAFSSSFND
ncbi:TPA: hypothetical protein ACH3X2_012034 [Trebouxia sp. C0005]